MKRDGEDEPTGYRKPPRSTRFPKGRSGNPKGRPKGRMNEIPYETVLGRKVPIREDGVERQVTAAEAFLLHLTKRGLEGDGAAIRAVSPAVENARAVRQNDSTQHSETITVISIERGSPNFPLDSLRMARKLDRFRDTARIALEPWLIEAALYRLGDRRLSLEEQVTVVRATRTPHKVKWPSWWKAEC